MRILLIGSGAREHAILWKLLQSPLAKKVYCAPGNGGIAELAECVNIDVEDTAGLMDFARKNDIDLTVVGPEVPLSLGIVDLFEEKGLRIFGPRQAAAMLESSKAFSKDFMERHGIPTARYKIYDCFEVIAKEIDTFSFPVVLKTDGLAAGKGVLIAENKEEALKAAKEMLYSKKFGEAGSKIVMEEYLTGKEVTLLAFADGKTIVPMVSAQDYKRAYDGDLGLNTGGMGAVSPAFYYKEEDAGLIYDEILKKTLDALNDEGIEYKGVLYFGLMLTDKGTKVLEYNARFGDPETEVVLPRLKTDLIEIMNAVLDGKLDEMKIEWSKEQAVCVVLASGGYPESYDKGMEIHGLHGVVQGQSLQIFHAGSKKEKNHLVTSGGRVLVVSALGETIESARKKAYEAVEGIHFDKMHYRKEIGDSRHGIRDSRHGIRDMRPEN